MIVFRLCRNRYSEDLSGKGAELSGGRWNSKGKPMLYTSSSRALCLLEMTVHLPLDFLPADFSLVTIFIPDNLKIMEVLPENLPANWNNFPYPPETQIIGDHLLSQKKHSVLKVPSAIVSEEYNYLINPFSTAASTIQIKSIVPFSLDDRLRKLAW